MGPCVRDITLFGSKEVSWGPGWFFMVFHVPGWFFMVFHGFSMVFHGSKLVFHGFFMVFHVPGWFFMVFHGSRLVFLYVYCILARRSNLGLAGRRPALA